MTIKEAALKTRDHNHTKYNVLSGPGGATINIAKALNGFVVLVNGDSVICDDIAELQEFLEEYWD